MFVLIAARRPVDVPISSRTVVSLTLPLAGVVLIAGAAALLSPRALRGNLLALGGAVAAAGYMVVGTKRRGRAALEYGALDVVGQKWRRSASGPGTTC